MKNLVQKIFSLWLSLSLVSLKRLRCSRRPRRLRSRVLSSSLTSSSTRATRTAPESSFVARRRRLERMMTARWFIFGVAFVIDDDNTSPSSSKMNVASTSTKLLIPSYSNLPHPAKTAKGGEDAWFIKPDVDGGRYRRRRRVCGWRSRRGPRVVRESVGV